MCHSLIISDRSIFVIQRDLTEMQTDAIVNAANEWLQHGGGVAGAILRRGGQSIQQESDDWIAQRGSVKTGTVAITGSGNLPCKYVIHAVGPVWGSGNEDEKLRLATENSLLMAEKYQLKSIAFPAISTGIFGFPVERCAQIMLAVTRNFLQLSARNIKEITFCLWNRENCRIFENELER